MTMIEKLNKAFSKLPGVGSKTAQRFIYYLLERDRLAGLELSNALKDAMENVQNCAKCRTLTEKDICEICSNDSRDNSLLCVVETPSDIHVIEQSGVYTGKYFVLSGYLSPIDGIGASELGLDDLADLLSNQEVSELILATNATIEGEVTAHYIHNLAKKYQIKTTRIAHGIPLGGELEYTDINTIAHALSGRKDYN